jgi:hypothetical protein
VARFAGSGLSRGEFARRHGLPLGTLDRWRVGPQPRSAPPAEAGAVLQEVDLSGLLPGAPWVAEVQRPDGLTVRLSAAALPWLERLLARTPC